MNKKDCCICICDEECQCEENENCVGFKIVTNDKKKAEALKNMIKSIKQVFCSDDTNCCNCCC